jgi:hypothetical protein
MLILSEYPLAPDCVGCLLDARLRRSPPGPCATMASKKLRRRRAANRHPMQSGASGDQESLPDSFQTYLRRQKTIGCQRDYYLNLLRFVLRLLRLGSPKKNELLALRECDWLLAPLA